ncbi:MAG: hypothetical protein K2N85_00565, partial [Lachnospiraceae bacterium]|nr:hypothetical protein [Lachnospiraceae bacterium]
MAKKFGKFVMTTAAIGALVAGACYYLKKKDSLDDDYFDEEDDYDDFDEDLDEEGTDKKSEADRKYVDLDLTKAADAVSDKADAVSEKAEDFKEGLDAAKADAEDKIVGAVEGAAKAVNNAEPKVEEFCKAEDN